jgi:hypothetical protein
MSYRRQGGLSRPSGGWTGGWWCQLRLLLLEVSVNPENFLAANRGGGCAPRNQLGADYIYEERVVSQKVYTKDGKTYFRLQEGPLVQFAPQHQPPPPGTPAANQLSVRRP